MDNNNAMTLKIEIKMDNAAFGPCNGTEIARILEKICVRWYDEDIGDGESIRLLDLNGNHVGEARVTR